MKSITLYLKDDKSDKEYSIYVQPKGAKFEVVCDFGRRGGTMQRTVKTKTPIALDIAEVIYQETLDEKLAKGYRPAGTPKLAEVASRAGKTPIAVELLTEIQENAAAGYIANDKYWMQVKLDGHRVQIEKTPNGYVAYSKKGASRSLPYEVVTEFAGSPFKTFLMDGELCGSTYFAFDLLSANGIKLTEAPYSERYTALLKGLPKDAPHVAPVVTWKTSKEKLRGLDALKENRCEGAVFRLVTAPYRSGRNGNNFKYKFIKSMSCKVTAVGFQSKDNAVLSVWGGNRWTEVGRASTIGKGSIKVGDIVEVKFLYVGAGHRLVQPRIVMNRTDELTDMDCALSQLDGNYKEGVTA